MPGKVNPVMETEVINQVAFQVIGNDHNNLLSVRSRDNWSSTYMEPVLVFN